MQEIRDVIGRAIQEATGRFGRKSQLPTPPQLSLPQSVAEQIAQAADFSEEARRLHVREEGITKKIEAYGKAIPAHYGSIIGYHSTIYERAFVNCLRSSDEEFPYWVKFWGFNERIGTREPTMPQNIRFPEDFWPQILGRVNTLNCLELSKDNSEADFYNVNVEEDADRYYFFDRQGRYAKITRLPFLMRGIIDPRILVFEREGHGWTALNTGHYFFDKMTDDDFDLVGSALDRVLSRLP